MAEIEFLNKVFGDWLVLEKAGTDLYKCKCIHCNDEIRDIRGYYLKTKPPKAKCMKNDILNKQFGELKVIEKLHDGFVICKCSCENTKTLHRRYLQNGSVTSCGHDKIGETSKLINITNKEFGTWIVDSYYGNKIWNCRCKKCNRERKIRGHLLRGKDIPTCICEKTEIQRKEYFDKKGVYWPKQLNSSRTLKQIMILESRENLLTFIQNNFSNKPTIRDISIKTGIDQPSILRNVRKHGLETYVQIGVFRSHYETDIAKIFPCNNIGDRKALRGSEIDLYYPDCGVGIEFNGNYWHSEVQKDKIYHANKSMIAKRANIHLIHIFEYEWKDEETQDKLIKYLDRLINKNIVNINAKDCVIGQIDKEQAKHFLNRHHLHGYAESKVNLGIKYNNDLICVMTLSVPKFNSEYQWELTRMAYKNDIVVENGFEKMFKYFLDNYNPSSIVAYCDISKFDGEVYTKLGFRIEELTPPNYKWVDMSGDSVLNRYQTQKSQLVAKGFGTDDQTEVEIMHNLGYLRVYDCGSYKFVWRQDN